VVIARCESKARSHVPVCDARKVRTWSPPAGAARHVTLAAVFLIGGAAVASAENRTLTLHHIHTREDITITFKRSGVYDQDALKRLDTFVGDWRKHEEVKMDPQLYDMMWEVQREVGHKGAIHIVCGYRSPATNAMLRSRSGGVARTSLHMQGKAMDFSLPGADVAAVRAAALRIQGGGVGYYPSSGIAFVHMDVGSVRHWPRMTRDQLAKVFPDGRTLHLSSDGPLPGYELALADQERGVSRRSSEPRQRNLLASLFGGAQDTEEVDDTASARQRAATPARRPAAAPAPAPEPTAAVAEAKPVPLPPTRPTFQVASAPTTFQVASAESRPVAAPPARPAQAASLVNFAALSPNQVITARGYWLGPSETSPDAAEPPATAVSAARRVAPQPQALESADTTASLGPFQRNDRVPTELALAYASRGDSEPLLAAVAPARVAPAVVANRDTASIALKPTPLEPAAEVRPVNATQRLDDPWLRGVVMAPSVQTAMTTTTFGAPDFRGLTPFMQKPPSTVMMTFSGDPHLGMTTEQFTGSAIVFQATVTFGVRTAQLAR
jgi:uncharacterized protein YcbK (DUF882 family)